MASWSGARKQVQTKPSSYNTNVVSSFEPDDPVTLVATVDSSTAWLGYHTKSYLMLVTEEGNIIKTINVKFKIDHIAIDMNGDLLMTVFNGHHVKKLTKSGDVVDVADTAPLQSRGICVNGIGEILVALSTLNYGNGEVRKISPEGKVLQNIRYKKGTTTPLFSVPFRVKQSVTGDICVLDASFSRDSRRFILLDANGHTKFTYPVEGDPMQNRFNPMNVETDIYGNILIGDTTFGVHLLDEDGIFIQFILSKADGLEISRGLSVDPAGKLWVCSAGNDKVYVLTYDVEEENKS